MKAGTPDVVRRLWTALLVLVPVLLGSMVLGLSTGATESGFLEALRGIFQNQNVSSLADTIIWQVRFPRVLLAALVGGVLSLGGLVFQALLRNPLAEPYILGISGGSAIGAIIGILLGFARFPGVCLTAFAGSMGTLALILFMASGRTLLKQNSLLLSGVMVNAFCSALIMFLVSMTQDSRLHNIMFWLMGDLSLTGLSQVGILAGIAFPCFVMVFFLSNQLNLVLMGRHTAESLGVNFGLITVMLLISTSLMVSATVSYTGLLGFVGLVMPHLLRLILGPDHRILVPACLLGGGAYMVTCDALARTLSRQGELPVGVITAMIGAPLFIYLLRKSGP